MFSTKSPGAILDSRQAGPAGLGPGWTQQQICLRLRRIEQGLALLQRGADGGRAGRHQPLHQNHQEADVALLGCHGLVVAVAHIVGHRLVQALLRAMSCLPGHRLQPGDTRLEQRLTFGVDRCALFRCGSRRGAPDRG